MTITGPRQHGMAKLCQGLLPQNQNESLEAPDTGAFATEDARAFLAQFREGVILDEIQTAPDLLSYLQG